MLPINEFKIFNLGNGIEDYILPSLNLSPKVHKLKERASIDNEKLLTKNMVSHSKVLRLSMKKHFFVFQAFIVLCKNCLGQQSEYCLNEFWTYS